VERNFDGLQEGAIEPLEREPMTASSRTAIVTAHWSFSVLARAAETIRRTSAAESVGLQSTEAIPIDDGAARDWAH
jgi:hypothetical protein